MKILRWGLTEMFTVRWKPCWTSREGIHKPSKFVALEFRGSEKYGGLGVICGSNLANLILGTAMRQKMEDRAPQPNPYSKKISGFGEFERNS